MKSSRSRNQRRKVLTLSNRQRSERVAAAKPHEKYLPAYFAVVSAGTSVFGPAVDTGSNPITDLQLSALHEVSRRGAPVRP